MSGGKRIRTLEMSEGGSSVENKFPVRTNYGSTGLSKQGRGGVRPSSHRMKRQEVFGVYNVHGGQVYYIWFCKLCMYVF